MKISEVFGDVDMFIRGEDLIRDEDLYKVCVVSEDEGQGFRVVPIKTILESKDFELERVETELRATISKLETALEEKDLELEAATSEHKTTVSNLRTLNEDLRAMNQSLSEEIRLRNRRIQEMERIMNNNDIDYNL